ncbi:MAG: hypothetical protein HKN34_11575, partial [Gammaproteobacteria bacterium]|nr:hypothetical protein [Gammaproteobacteria bacterium]
MNEVDLIPAEYRRKRQFTGWLKNAGIILSAMLVIVFGFVLVLKHSNANFTAEINQMKEQRTIASENGQRLKQLVGQKKGLQQQLKLLAGLRSGSSAEQMLVTMDNALSSPRVWLTQWNFRRASNRVDEKPATVNTGYFIVVPDGQQNAQKETWKIETTMLIQGQAMDHVAMSEFVASLTRQPDIENVRIVSSRLNRGGQVKL